MKLYTTRFGSRYLQHDGVFVAQEATHNKSIPNVHVDFTVDVFIIIIIIVHSVIVSTKFGSFIVYRLLSFD